MSPIRCSPPVLFHKVSLQESQDAVLVAKEVRETDCSRRTAGLSVWWSTRSTIIFYEGRSDRYPLVARRNPRPSRFAPRGTERGTIGGSCQRSRTHPSIAGPFSGAKKRGGVSVGGMPPASHSVR